MSYSPAQDDKNHLQKSQELGLPPTVDDKNHLQKLQELGSPPNKTTRTTFRICKNWVVPHSIRQEQPSEISRLGSSPTQAHSPTSTNPVVPTFSTRHSVIINTTRRYQNHHHKQTTSKKMEQNLERCATLLLLCSCFALALVS